MIKFLHAADFHLDAPFSSLSRAAAVRRRQEQREAVAALVRACNEAQCDVMLLAGDLLDSDAAYPETIACLTEQFAACIVNRHGFVNDLYLTPVLADDRLYFRRIRRITRARSWSGG